MKPLNELIADQNDEAFVQLFKYFSRALYARTWKEKWRLFEYARNEAIIHMYHTNTLIRRNLQEKKFKS
jgi:hypothetical protein